MRSLVIALVCLMACSRVTAQEQKLKLEDVIARHLAALGSAEARASARHRAANGKVQLRNRLGGGSSANSQGEGLLASDGPKLRFVMQFPSNEYPGEDVAYDGKDVTSRLQPQGRRSNLREFLKSQPLLLKEGLLSGVLGTGWGMMRLDQLKPSLNYRGLRKVEGKELHEVIYVARKGNDSLRITLHFEPETFRHVRSTYSYELGARMGSNPTQSSQLSDTRYELLETFDDFRVVDGLTLPHKYNLQLTIQAQNGNLVRDWIFDLTSITHKDKPGDEVFVIK